MFKRILLLLTMLLLAAYLVVALTLFNRKPAGAVCRDVELLIRDTVNAGFITKKEVSTILTKKGLNPIGLPLDSLHTGRLEEELGKHPLIDEVECFTTPVGNLCVAVSQRIPVLRIMNNRGENYYVDNKGATMPFDMKCVAHLPVVTGNVEKSFAMRDLYKFALFLQGNPFWEAQIEQINVLPGRQIELVPRVGDHIIYLGRLDGYEQKLARLKKFYEKGLNRVGWNKYSRISVEFGNQVICTKAKH